MKINDFDSFDEIKFTPAEDVTILNQASLSSDESESADLLSAYIDYDPDEGLTFSVEKEEESELGASVEVEASGTLKVEPQCEWQGDTGLQAEADGTSTVQDVKTGFSTDVQIEASASGSLESELDIGEIEAIGPYGLVFKGEISFHLKSEGSVSASAEVEGKAGVIYTQETGFTTYGNYDSPEITLTAEASSTAEIFPRFEGMMDVTAIPVVGAYVDIGAGFSMTSTIHNTVPKYCKDEVIYLLVRAGIDDEYGIMEAIIKCLESQMVKVEPEWTIFGKDTDENPLKTRKHYEKDEKDDEYSETAYDVCTYYVPEDAVEYNGHHYKVYGKKGRKTWDDAKTDCEKRGGHLATITSEGENDVIFELVDEYGYVAWIGGFTNESYSSKDNWASGWEWITGEEFTYTNWDDGEPSYNSVNSLVDYAPENRLAIGSIAGTWFDYNKEGYTSKIKDSSGLYSTITYHISPYVCEWDY